MILDFADAPDDPVKRVFWLAELERIVAEEIAEQYQRAYFTARLQGTLDAAIDFGPHARRRVIEMTRRENERRGRTVRWGDL